MYVETCANSSKIRTAMTAQLLEQRPDFNEVWLAGSLLGRLSTQDEFRGEFHSVRVGTLTWSRTRRVHVV